MINYIEYLNMPIKVAVFLVGMFLVIQVTGELLEFKGKIVPEFFKIRKYFARKKQERETLSKMTEIFEDFQKVPNALNEVKTLLNDIDQHYNHDNISKRNEWMDWVNNRAKVYDAYEHNFVQLQNKIEENNKIILSLLIDSKRSIIINFASKVIDEKYPVTKEQFNRVFKIYREYEEIIRDNDLVNGEVDIAIRIIQESYEEHMKCHSFIEDIRGYNLT